VINYKVIGNAPPVNSLRTAVVYDDKTGRVLGIHTVVVMKGASEPSTAEIERTAVELFGREANRVPAAVLVEQESLNRIEAKKVDVKTRRLVLVKR
jgi:hypothetical protein